MYHLALEFIQFVVGIVFIIQAYRSVNKRILNYLIGIAFILLFIIDLDHTYKVIDQIYFLKEKQIRYVEIKGFSKYDGTTSIDNTIKIDQVIKVRDLKKKINSARVTSLHQPNTTKSVVLDFVQNDKKRYEYLIEATTNNGILISVKIGDNFYGGFRNDSLFKCFYSYTKNSFFHED